MNWFGTNVSWVVIVIILVIVLAISLFFPWQKVKNRKQQKSDLINKPIDEKNKNNSESIIPNFMGIYNSIGKSESVRMKKLVYVEPKENSCELCIKYENTVLSLEVIDKNYLTMAEAISNGYHHLGCTHKDIDYYPGDTELKDKFFTQEEQIKFHQLILEQFKLENNIRNIKYDLENKNSKSVSIEDLNKAIEKLDIFCKENNLTRNFSREEPEISDLKKFTK
ncbi:hypothetical protein SGLAD_v1c05750 [Spiroplasma gladiatoris]|uniref:Uncharacterized protein n=1 Tax=Spiroplasma gladiatoris TaxID=2143 RepID=A0A4P7AH55_9MOLU|nr:hypothetical protein [Spiroplasma gladiatoris]QBQ07774.1 hypothetical protein SGLAD_v1c05750 [Spiroplasma gladiatoris]